MEQRYTANEYAQLAGGHTVEETKPSLQLSIISDLNESTMFRSKQQVQTTDARFMIDFAFINLLTIELLFNEGETNSSAQSYAAKTIQYQNFNSYQQSGTDLYIALNSILTKKLVGDRLVASKINKLAVPYSKIKDYLIKLSNGVSYPGANAFFFSLERSFDITNSNYKDLRRLITNWSNLDDNQQKLVVTRLLQFYRTTAIRSELYQVLNDYAREQDLELKNVKNAEQPRSSVSPLSKL